MGAQALHGKPLETWCLRFFTHSKPSRYHSQPSPSQPLTDIRVPPPLLFSLHPVICTYSSTLY